MPNPRMLEGYRAGIDDDSSSNTSREERAEFTFEDALLEDPVEVTRQTPSPSPPTTPTDDQAEDEGAQPTAPLRQIQVPSTLSFQQAEWQREPTTNGAVTTSHRRQERHQEPTSSGAVRTSRRREEPQRQDRPRHRRNDDGEPEGREGDGDRRQRRSERTRRQAACLKRWIIAAVVLIVLLLILVIVVAVVALGGDDDNTDGRDSRNEEEPQPPIEVDPTIPPSTLTPDTLQLNTLQPTTSPTMEPTVKQTLAPTSSPAPTPSPKCFTGLEELSEAVDKYVEDPTGGLTASDYGHPIGSWCITGVSDLSLLFFAGRNRKLETFNHDISAWSTGSVTRMQLTFSDLSDFDQDLSAWDTSRVTDFTGTFNSCTNFQGDSLSTWNTTRARTMRGMFAQATRFNGDLSVWNVENVLDTSSMFRDATSFNQNLCAWGSRLKQDVAVDNMFSNTNCSDEVNPDMSASPPGPFCQVCTNTTTSSGGI